MLRRRELAIGAGAAGLAAPFAARRLGEPQHRFLRPLPGGLGTTGQCSKGTYTDKNSETHKRHLENVTKKEKYRASRCGSGERRQEGGRGAQAGRRPDRGSMYLGLHPGSAEPDAG